MRNSPGRQQFPLPTIVTHERVHLLAAQKMVYLPIKLMGEVGR